MCTDVPVCVEGRCAGERAGGFGREGAGRRKLVAGLCPAFFFWAERARRTPGREPRTPSLTPTTCTGVHKHCGVARNERKEEAPLPALGREEAEGKRRGRESVSLAFPPHERGGVRTG